MAAGGKAAACARPIVLREWRAPEPWRYLGGDGRWQQLEGVPAPAPPMWTAHGRSVEVRCGNRRRSVCAGCSDLYQGDTRRLLAEGLGDAAGVLLTLTAPGAEVFGTGHHHESARRRCHKQPYRCSCGELVACGGKHRKGDPECGAPLHERCFNYFACAEWNMALPKLRAATFALLNRRLRAAGQPRLRYMAVVEYQARALMHLHVLIAGWPFQPGALEQLVRNVRVPVDGVSLREATWGRQVKVQPIPRGDGGETAERRRRGVRSYLAKYVAKAVADPIDESGARLDAPVVRHNRRVATAVGNLSTCTHEAYRSNRRAGPCPWCRNRRRQLGYLGHVVTKSHSWPSFAAARRRRLVWRAERDPEWLVAASATVYVRLSDDNPPMPDRGPPGWADLALLDMPVFERGMELEFMQAGSL